MLYALMIRLAPVLIPALLYALWLLFITRRARDGRPVAEHIRKSVNFWTIIACAITLILSFLFWGIMRDAPKQGRYVPPRMVDGVLQPAQILPEDNDDD